MILDLHHVQLAMPEGGEELARTFYSGILSLQEVEKPAQLRMRGGAWFESGYVRVHLGVEKPFTAAQKAHPAFRVSSLEDTILLLVAQGIEIRRDIDLPDMKRVYVSDPFGNRIELLELLPVP
jgi:catechol 2,3-dioxygenase-like lactoylglutathione lyase family enzyme